MEQLPITYSLIIATGFISWQALNKHDMQLKLLFHPYTIKHNHDYFRFITHGFVHASVEHLLINMLVLYQFGQVIEPFFKQTFGVVTGPILFITLYLTAIVVAAIPDYFKHQEDRGYAAVGASGATSAIVFSYVLLDPWNWFFFPPVPAIVFGVLYLLYSSYMARRAFDNIAHDAHFWGGVYGFIYMLITIYALKPILLGYLWQQFISGPSWPF